MKHRQGDVMVPARFSLESRRIALFTATALLLLACAGKDGDPAPDSSTGGMAGSSICDNGAAGSSSAGTSSASAGTMSGAAGDTSTGGAAGISGAGGSTAAGGGG